MTAPGPNHVFYSKISWALFGFIFLSFGMPLVLLLWQGAWLGVGIILVTSWLPLSIYRNTRYEISGDQLLITCGFLYNLKVNISRIRSIQDSRSLLSSPALSLDRQEIKYNKYDEVLISLKDEDKGKFYTLIKQLNPQVQIL